MASTAARLRPEDCTSVHTHTRSRTAREEKKSVTAVLSTLMRVRMADNTRLRKPRDILLEINTGDPKRESSEMAQEKFIVWKNKDIVKIVLIRERRGDK